MRRRRYVPPIEDVEIVKEELIEQVELIEEKEEVKTEKKSPVKKK